MQRPRFHAAMLCALIGALASPAAHAQAPAAAAGATAPRSPFADMVGEAARRFVMPERWIWAVMRAESGGNPRAVSHAGAMGLMQVMPATWAELRTRYRLGRDPFDPRDNILAGVAYMREMYDAFGSPGFLGAYNAGPHRYREYLRGRRGLPHETRLYIARVTRDMGEAAPPRMIAQTSRPQDWSQAGLFVTRTSDVHDESIAAAPQAQAQRSSPTDIAGDAPPAARTQDTIFVPRNAPQR